tara:strand:- start:37 stop:591 length:555 start_codon:yes stop_codon:yes gene_type:complete
MTDRINPWWLRLLTAAAGAWLAALLVSGTILLIAYEIYNPWYQPGESHHASQAHVLANAFGNIAEHGAYAFVILLIMPIWLSGFRASRLTSGFLSVLFAFAVSAAITGLFLWSPSTDISITDLAYGEDRTYFVAGWDRIYVPDYLYLVAGWTLPVAAVVSFACLDSLVALGLDKLGSQRKDIAS